MRPSKESVFTPKTFAMPLLEWHSRHGRVLPWITKHPYDVWLSEVMLQQTQVATVMERYAAFKVCFPTIECLASAPVEDVLAQWSGLGYYRRARNLHACAQHLVAWMEKHGDWPREAEQWINFPGIGQSTANAIVSACFDKVMPILDANAKRVLLRFAGDLGAGDKEAWSHAYAAMEVEAKDAAKYTQAMMDLGATICTARKAHCTACPLKDGCKSKGWTKDAKIDTVKKEPSAKQIVGFEWVLCTRTVAGTREMLLQQRDEMSFWPGLWILPKNDARFKLSAGSVPQELKHELSHRSLRIRVHAGVLVGDTLSNERWVSLSEIAERLIPAPSPVQVLANGAA